MLVLPPIGQINTKPAPVIPPGIIVQKIQSGLSLKPQPQFPDYSSNYQKTIVIPQQQAEAAAQAQAAAEAAQAAQQAQVATYTAPPSYSGSCASWMAQAGITDPANAIILINMESGCNPTSVNPKSGACGIGQQLPCGKWAHAWNDPVGALIDMQNYTLGTYGSWANAVAFHLRMNWY